MTSNQKRQGCASAEVHWRDAEEGILDLFDSEGNPISEATVVRMAEATSWLRDFYDGWRTNVRKRLRELESNAAQGRTRHMVGEISGAGKASAQETHRRGSWNA